MVTYHEWRLFLVLAAVSMRKVSMRKGIVMSEPHDGLASDIGVIGKVMIGKSWKLFQKLIGTSSY